MNTRLRAETPNRRTPNFADISHISDMNASYIVQHIKPTAKPVDKVKRIFDYYCQIGDKLNSKFLKSSKLHKMFEDSEILSKTLSKKRLDLIVSKEKKGKSHYLFDFSSFMHILMGVASYKYIYAVEQKSYGMTPKKAFNKLLSDHVYPLHDAIYERKEQKANLDLTIITHHDAEIDDTLLEILSHSIDTLLDIYKLYFKAETSISKDVAYIRKDSEKAFLKFSREFDVIQGKVTVAAVFQLFNVELTSAISFVFPDDTVYKNQGKCFTFSKFLNCLIKVSNFLPGEFLHLKFLSLLDKMQCSDGFLNMEKKTNWTHSAQKAFIVPPSNMKLYKEELEQLRRMESEQSGSAVETRVKQKVNGQNKLKFIRKGKFLEIDFLESTHGKTLYRLFVHFASFGENKYMITMKSSKFSKFLREAGLFNDTGLKVNDVDTIFYQLVKGSKRSKSADRLSPREQPKLGFEGFLKAMEIIADICGFERDLHNSVVKLLNEYILPLASRTKNANLSSLKEFVKNREELVLL